MTFTFKCYQNNFMINHLNIASVGDCFGSIIVCMAFALLIEVNRGIGLYLRYYSVTSRTIDSNLSNRLSERTTQRRRFILHLLRTLVHFVQTALSYLLMLMVMNNFAGFLLAAVIALGIGYYLLNGVHPYTRSATHVHLSNANSDLTNPTEILNETDESSLEPTTTNSHQQPLTVNT